MMKLVTKTLRQLKHALQHQTSPRSVRFVSSLTLTDAAFLAKFALPAVATPLAQGNVAAAQRALLAHYQKRITPRWPAFPYRPSYMPYNVYELTPTALHEQAEAVVAQRFTCFNRPPITFSGRVNWRHDPTTDPKARWARELNRFGWLAPLAVAYQQSGDERYAQTFVRLLQDWITKNPPPAQRDEKDPIWTLMNVGMRALQWTAAFALFTRSPAFTDAAKLLFLRAIDDHARFLALYKTHANHLLRESLGLAALGIYYPEFREAEQWRTTAFARLATAVQEQVNVDGSHYEVSTGYQWLAIEEFAAMDELIYGNGYALPGVDLPHTLEKMHHLLAHLIRPDGTLPEINDGSLGAPDLLANELVKAGQRFVRSDLLFIGSRGALGAPPVETSVAFANAGFYVMRSDWSSDARYLLLDAGPYGGLHGHEDKLSIELYAYGQPWIVDAGSYTYNHIDPWRRYFVSSAAHNTVLVDGLSQVRRWQKKVIRPEVGTTANATWHSGADLDYVKAHYADGYGDFHLDRPKAATVIDDVRHTRHLCFVKPDYWVIVDALHATAPHTYHALFHAHPAVTVSAIGDNGVLLAATPKAAYVTCLPADSTVKMQLVRGSEAPRQGWYSAAYGQKEPATTICLEQQSAAQTPTITYLTTLLYPSQTAPDQRTLSITPLTVSGAAGVAYVVQTPQGKDYLLISANRERKAFGPYESTGQVALVRTGQQAQVISRGEW